jgi:hypothetical protein
VLGPAPHVAWTLLGWVGLALVLVGGTDIALTWYPPNIGSPEWEFATVTASLNGLPSLTLGFALLLGNTVAHGRRWGVLVVASVFVLLALYVLFAAFLYATNVPMALSSIQDPLILTGLKKAIAKTSVQVVVYSLLFGFLSVQGFRHLKRDSRRG